ncbi:MAG TPA: cell division protein FtsH, partial [Corynebacterium sp.]|nr:cell division protein FtsH [Corynebacterium sp.]
GMYNRDELFARLVFAMGGRAAEELVFGEQTTGASADIEQATKIARAMITEYGMSPSLGMVKYGEEQGDPFSGRPGGGVLTVSPAVAARIDDEVHLLLDAAHRTAYNILAEYRDHLDVLAEKLLEKETLRRPDLEVLFEDIEPMDAPEIFPHAENHFPKQEGREPVKTPVEIALERGEEPPKRFSLLEASRQARARRQAELAAQGEAAEKADGDTPETPATPSAPTAPGARYGGTPPPADWTAPGWPPSENPYATSGEHPGMKNYGETPGAAKHRAPEEPAEDTPTEIIGFRLPDHEQPDHGERGDAQPEEYPATGADDVAEPDHDNPQLPKE